MWSRRWWKRKGFIWKTCLLLIEINLGIIEYLLTVVLEKTLESPLDCKEIQPVQPKGNQSWIFLGRIDAKAETPILWPLDTKNWLIWKASDAGNDWRWEEKGTTEDEIVRWHHWLNGHEFEYVAGDGEGQEAWCAAVQGSQSQIQLQDSTTTTKTLSACLSLNF